MSKRNITSKTLGQTVKPAARAPTKLKAVKPTQPSRQFVSAKQNRSVTAPQTGGQRHIKEKGMDHEKMDSNLKKKSPWYQSLRDPLQGAGAKIPDETGINTASMQLVQKVSVAINAQGVAACEITTPYINQIGSGAGSNYKVSGPTATGAVLTWLADSAFSNSLSMQGVAGSHRVVSAAIFGEYEGTTLNDSGDCTAYFLPYSINALTSVGQIQQRYGSSVIPVNKARSKPAVSRWFPINVASQSFKDFVVPTNTAAGVGLCPRWVLGLVYQGLQVNSGSVVFTIVVNYEFVPLLNAIDYITPTASPIDPIEEQMVQQWIQEDSMTGIASNKLVDVQAGSQVVDAALQGNNAEAGFGMLGGIITELAPMLIGALL